MKTLVTLFLAAAILAVSMPQSRAPEPQPQMAAQCIVAVLVIVVGGVCIIGIIKCCKLLNQLDPPEPPPTNTIPIIPTNSIPTNNLPWTNPPLASYPMSLLTTNSIVTVQQSLGLGDWADVLTVTLTNLGDRVALSSGGLQMTSMLVNGQAVFFLPAVPQPPSNVKFFRLLSTP